MTRVNRKNMVLLFLITFSFFLSLDILQLPLPLYIEILGGSPSVIGWLMGITGIATVILRPFLGAWCDTYGKKGILLVGMVTWFLAPLFLLTIESFFWMALVRIFQSIGMASVILATQALMADQVYSENRGKAMALQGIGDASGLVLGPLVGYWLLHNFGFTWVFLAAAISAAIGLLLSFFVDEKSSQQFCREAKQNGERVHWRLLVREPMLIFTSFIGFGIALAFGAMLFFMAVYTNQMGITNWGYLFSFLGVFLIIGRYLSGRISDNVDRNVVLLPTLLITAMGMFVMAFSSHGVTFFVACGLVGLGFGGGHTGLSTYVIEKYAQQNRGFVLSYLGNSFDLGVSAAGFFFGMVAGVTSYEIAYGLIGVVVLILGLIGVKGIANYRT